MNKCRCFLLTPCSARYTFLFSWTPWGINSIALRVPLSPTFHINIFPPRTSHPPSWLPADIFTTATLIICFYAKQAHQINARITQLSATLMLMSRLKPCGLISFLLLFNRYAHLLNESNKIPSKIFPIILSSSLNPLWKEYFNHCYIKVIP